jgi:hypothetical protein
MTYNPLNSDRFFSQGYKTLTNGTFIFGGILFLLAILIFAYPMLIAYFIAGMILLAGVATLTLGWKLRRARENISSTERWEAPTFVDANKEYRTRAFYFRWPE